MTDRTNNLASQVVGTRVRALNAWRDRIQNAAERRNIQAERNNHSRVSLDRFNPRAEIRTTNPNTLPPSKSKLNPTNETIGPAIRMSSHHRDMVTARALLATDQNRAIFFNQ